MTWLMEVLTLGLYFILTVTVNVQLTSPVNRPLVILRVLWYLVALNAALNSTLFLALASLHVTAQEKSTLVSFAQGATYMVNKEVRIRMDEIFSIFKCCTVGILSNRRLSLRLFFIAFNSHFASLFE